MSVDDRDERDPLWTSLSAMADGEADATERARCLAQWGERADVRARWCEYHVIGDALRSQELAQGAADDAAFVRTLRERLAHDRVVPLRPRAERSPGRWLGGAAVAAGVGAVALTLTMIGPSGTAFRADTSLAAAPAAPAVANVSNVVNTAGEAPVTMADGQLIRDARLDRYLAAHRQGATGAALQMPGAVVRSVDTLVLDR